MEESAETAKSSGQPNKNLINLLGGIALASVILMILFVLAALGFLLYGLLAAQLDVSIIGVVACVISFGLLFGLFRWIIKAAHLQAQGQKERSLDDVTTGKQPPLPECETN